MIWTLYLLGFYPMFAYSQKVWKADFGWSFFAGALWPIIAAGFALRQIFFVLLGIARKV